ncbi:hypothetical protein KKB99_00230 [bacterium]|nr:hypothetical protein [bacterium]MBU1024411.1 hypothetical protein [bacterium]
MLYAQGIYLLPLGPKYRVYLKGSLARCFGLKPKETSGAIIHVGYNFDPDKPSLVIVPDENAKYLLEQTFEIDLENFDDMPTDDDESKSKRMSEFRQVEIKSRKIQFQKNEINHLNLAKDEKQVIFYGRSTSFIVWSESEFAKRYPREYRKVQEDEPDET